MKNSHGSAPPSSKKGATEEEIIEIVNALSLNYLRPVMTEGQLTAWLKTFCLDLAGRTKAELESAATKYRRDPSNHFMATSGQLLALCRREKDRRILHGRIVDGVYQPWGGACQCWRCVHKPHSEGFFVAPAEAYRRDEQIRAELDDWMKRKMEGPLPARPEPTERPVIPFEPTPPDLAKERRESLAARLGEMDAAENHRANYYNRGDSP